MLFYNLVFATVTTHKFMEILEYLAFISAILGYVGCGIWGICILIKIYKDFFK